MTTEHVSVPRGELEEIARELTKRERNSVSPWARHFGEELEFILSRATPSDEVDAGVLKYDEREEQFAHFYHQHCGRGGLVLESVAYALDKIKPTAPRVVTAEDVERACQAFFVGNVRKPWPWRDTQDMDEPDAVFASMRSAISAIMGSLEASPNDDKDVSYAAKHRVFVYEVDFGDEGVGRYVRLDDFNKVCATLPPAAVPEGYVVVPVEPTDDMVEAFWGTITHGDVELAHAWDAYKDMLAAAPQPETQP